MNPILYESTETKFDTNGLGVLSDAISCIVTEERNGSFELTMQYSVEGIHFADIADRSIILAKPNPTDNAQPFRVYRSTKPLNGIVTFYARHISYDLAGIPSTPFSASNVVEALNNLKTHAVTDCPFSFWTDKVTSAKMTVHVPTAIRSLLGGQQGSILDTYGGEYKFDRYTVRLYNERGTDRGVSIRYGKNLLDLEQEKNCANVCTGVYPYWADPSGENLVQLPEKIVNAPGTYDFVRIKTLDLSSEWQEAPTIEQLRSRTESYIKENNIGVPTVSLTVSHAMLENTEEYKGQSFLERIDLCDTVRIDFPNLGVYASAKAIKTEYNVLFDRYESNSFGDARYTLADSNVEQKNTIRSNDTKTKSLVSAAMKQLNDTISNASGMYTTEELQSDGSTITYLHDKKTLPESKNVIKITSDAVGVSTDGGKSYPFGLYVNGDLVSRILNAVGINANWINTGILQSLPDEDGNRAFYLDLIKGILRMKATEFTISGRTVDDIAGDKANSALNSAKKYADDVSSGAVNDFVSAVYDPKISELQKQIDGQIESFFYDYEPTLKNEPASGWTTEEEKEKHEGDLFYWKSKGYAYRFFKDGKTWKWQLVQDTDVTKALADAAAAQHTADGKSRTFISQPVTPYDVGDQWYRGTDKSTLVCTKSRETGSFSMSDWEKLDNYIDSAEAISNVQAQYYLSDSPTKLSGGTWSDTQPTWKNGKYIWSRQYVTYGDGTYAYIPSESGVCITGNTGRGVLSSVVTYQESSSGTSTPGGSWSNTVPPVPAGHYLWTKTVIIYTDDDSTTLYTVSRIGADGEDGAPGKDGTNGKDGATGVGIKSITNYYLASAKSSGVTVDTSGWTTGVQSVSEANPYLWNYEITEYTDGSSTTVAPHVVGTYGRDGTNGKAGKGISSIVEHYLATASASGVTTSTSGWTTSLQNTDTTKKYLWNYETITYTDNSTSTVEPRIIGTHGATGKNGTNGTNAYTHIRYSASDDGSNFVDTPTAETIYIGVYNGTSATAPTNKASYTWSKYKGDKGDKGDKGAAGATGNGINSITYYYAVTQTQTAPDASKVTSTTIPTLSETNKYLWQKEVIDFTDSSVADKTTVILLAVYGDKGKDGTNGTNGTSVTIKSTSIAYKADTNGTTAPSSGWSATIPPVENGQYLWTKTVVTYSDGKSTTSYSVAYKGTNGTNGKDGAPGEDGIGIESVATEYYVSTSSAKPAGGSWSNKMPDVQSGKYIWTRQKITYSDGNVEYAGEYCMSKTIGDIAQQKVDAQTQTDIFNKLTNNGEDQGIFLKKGDDGVARIYINLEYLKSNIIDLNLLKLAGNLGGLAQGKGKDAKGNITDGIVIYGPKGLDDDGNAIPPYAILTSAGFRVQLTESIEFNISGTAAEMRGNIQATSIDGNYGDLIAQSNAYTGNSIFIGRNNPDSTSVNAYVGSNSTIAILGYSNLSKAVWAGAQGWPLVLHCSKLTSDAELVVPSDRSKKKAIEPIPEVYANVLDALDPVIYRYNTEDDRAPYHMGYVANDFEKAIFSSGLDRQSMAALSDTIDETGKKTMGIAYGELIALIHLKIKMLESRIKRLEGLV